MKGISGKICLCLLLVAASSEYDHISSYNVLNSEFLFWHSTTLEHTLLTSPVDIVQENTDCFRKTHFNLQNLTLFG